jgi:uncharacterized protein involved in outer membrane biogenesis
MRKILLIAGAVIGVFVVVVIGLVGYAVVNLNSIIASNRTYILTRASDALGRPIEAQDIKASVGWGVMMDISGVKIADDPAFSQLPFIQAGDVYAKVEFVPLLARQVKVTRLLLKEPHVRIIRDRAGILNVSTLSKKTGAAAPARANPGRKRGAMPSSPLETAPPGAGAGGGASVLNEVSIWSFSIQDGQVYYQDQQGGGAPITVNAVNLNIDNFTVGSPFDVALTLAALSEKKNLDISGQVGPLMRQGAIEIGAIPLNLAVTVGPLALAQVKALPQLAHAIPPELTISEPVSVDAKVAGTVDAMRFDIDGDLSSSQVVYTGVLDKPAGMPFKFAASGARENGNVALRAAKLTLAAVNMTGADITLAGGNLSARLDTNKFDLAEVARLVSAMQMYNPSGEAEIHATVRVAEHRPAVNGTVTLTGVAVAIPGGKAPPISGVSGTIKMAGNTATLGPLDFNLGSAHAKLQAAAQSIQPLKATYQFNVDTLKLGELVPSRQDLGEQLSQLAANGSLSRDGNVIAATTNISSSSGMVANVPYQNLALAAAYSGDRMTVESLKLNAFDGAVGASGVATLGTDPAFNLKLSADNLDVQKALEAQKAKAAETIRGILTGQVQVAGHGLKFDEIKPTLNGAGRASMRNGKLIGVNVVAQALNKVDNVPGIGALVPASVVANHPALFRSPDTDIQEASLTFQLTGPRITSHDIAVQSTDYSIMGDGWFDMDKNINLAARILMSKGFSDELIAAKQNASFLANTDGQIEIPLRITGQLPKPAVVPDVGILAQRAAGHAVQNQLGRLLRGKKGGGAGSLLGGFFGGGGGGGSGNGGGGAPPNGGSTPGAQPTPENPLNTLKGLFH